MNCVICIPREEEDSMMEKWSITSENKDSVAEKFMDLRKKNSEFPHKQVAMLMKTILSLESKLRAAMPLLCNQIPVVTTATSTEPTASIKLQIVSSGETRFLTGRTSTPPIRSQLISTFEASEELNKVMKVEYSSLKSNLR